MEVALERGCAGLLAGEGYDARRHIAIRIVECATSGDVTLIGLTRAAKAAAAEIEQGGGQLHIVQPSNPEGYNATTLVMVEGIGHAVICIDEGSTARLQPGTHPR